MKKAVFLSFTFTHACFSFAQPTFEKYYQLPPNYQFNLIELPGHNLNIGGYTLADPSGNIFQRHYFTGDTLYALRSFVQSGTNEFHFVTGYNKDTCSIDSSRTNTYPVIGKMDSLGNFLSLRYYPLTSPSCSNLPIDLEVTSNKDVIIWDSFALRTDSVGTPLWAKRFDRITGFQFIRELPGGDLLAGINMDTAGAVVARMDAAGNFLWLRSYIRPNGVIKDVVIGSDSSFVVIGYTDNTFPSTPVEQKLFMMKLDGSGDVQWCKGYEAANKWRPGHARIKTTQDGNYVILANLRGPDDARPFDDRPFLMKTDVNGDTLWTRSSGVGNYRYQTANLLAYSDGGFLHTGICSGDFGMNSSAMYLFKTDSLGHLPCSEAWYPTQVVNLFPVDSSFTLNSVDGATVHPAFGEGTISTNPVTVYDGCMITAIPDYWRISKFRVRPNPNTGHFTVQFDDPLVVDTFYSVYDAMGRLLYQRPLPTGATTEEIDLSRFGKGTYTMKVSDKDKVRVERVVVQ
mgnify:CR=1 FL=1